MLTMARLVDVLPVLALVGMALTGIEATPVSVVDRDPRDVSLPKGIDGADPRSLLSLLLTNHPALIITATWRLVNN